MKTLAWVLALAVGGASTATAAEPLTYAAALERAEHAAPSLQAKSLQIDAARSAAISAPALPDPKLTFGVDNFPISGPPAFRPSQENMTSASVGISQDVPNGAKRRARSARARAEITQAEADLLNEERTVRVSTALGWIDLLYAQRRLVALDELASKVYVEDLTAPAQVQSGAARPGAALEPKQASAALADRRVALLAEMTKARAELSRWIGPAMDADPAGPPPEYEVNAVALRASLDSLPVLQLKDAAVRRAEAEANAAKAEKRPDWSYELNYMRRDPRFGDMVGAKATVSLPLFAARRQDPLIAARLADVNRAIVEREVARRDLAAALERDLADHAMHQAQLTRANETLVPLAKSRVELELSSYAAGNAKLADVLAALRALVDEKLEAIQREAETTRDGARINLTYEGVDQ